MLDESGKIVSDLKRITGLMNKNLVNIAEKLLNERKDTFCNNLKFCLVQYVMILFSKNSLLVKLRCTLRV